MNPSGSGVAFAAIQTNPYSPTKLPSLYSFICGEQMVRLGMLTFLSKFIRECKEEDVLFVAVDLLSALVQHVEE